MMEAVTDHRKVLYNEKPRTKGRPDLPLYRMPRAAGDARDDAGGILEPPATGRGTQIPHRSRLPARSESAPIDSRETAEPTGGWSQR